MASIDFAVQLSPKRRAVYANLSFGCAIPESSKSSADLQAQGNSRIQEPRTARDEIRDEDSGGRYFRIITWQKKYRAENFKGTVAYVNSIFGDGIRMASPEYFLVCPETDSFTCFSMEIKNKIKLTQTEKDEIVKYLSNISHSD